MTTIKARALTQEHVRVIAVTYAPFVAAVLDTMPDYSLTSANIETEAAKAARWVSQTPAIINAVVAAGTDLGLEEVCDMPFLRRALLFRDVLQLTQSDIGLIGVWRAILAEVAPLSAAVFGARH